MRPIRLSVCAALILTTACTSGGEVDDTDIDTDGGAADDTDDGGSADDTDAGDTDVTDALPGTPVQLTNAGFESETLQPGAEVFQQGYPAEPLEIGGWSYYLGTSASGFGLVRPAEAMFGASEPLAAPAEGNVVGLLDARRSPQSTVGSSQMSVTLPELVSAGDVIHARVAFASRIDNSSVSLHGTVLLGVAFLNDSVVALPVTVTDDGTWVDWTISYEVPEGRDGQVARVYISAFQDPISDAYYQTFFDNVRVSIE